MIQNKTIFIAHNWTDSMICQQSKALALDLSKNNKVIFLSAKKTNSPGRVINENLVIYEWPGARPTTIVDFVFLVQLIKEHKPNIVLSNFAANNIMLLASWLFGVKLRISHYHTMVEQYIADNKRIGVTQRIKIWRKRIFFGFATHILPCSTAAKKDLLKYYGINEKKIFVFPNSVTDYNKENTSNNKVVGFVGRLQRSKGVDLLLDAFKIIALQIPEATLVIAGTGPLEMELKQKTKVPGLEGRIEFLGEISSKKVADFMCSINLLVVPSRTDNLPTVVLEAFSTATPVIASKSGGIPDMIEPGKNGLLFEKENVCDLAERMVEMLQDQELRNMMAANARKIFEERYNVSAFIDRFHNLIAPAVNKIGTNVRTETII